MIGTVCQLAGALLTGVFIFLGALVTVGLVPGWRGLPKRHVLNRSQGLCLMLIGAGVLIGDLASLCSVPWVASVVYLAGLLILGVSLWLLHKTSREIREYLERQNAGR